MKHYSIFDPQRYDEALEQGLISPRLYCQIKGIEGQEALELTHQIMIREAEKRKRQQDEEKRMKELEQKEFEICLKELEKQVPKAIEKLIADSLKQK